MDGSLASIDVSLQGGEELSFGEDVEGEKEEYEEEAGEEVSDDEYEPEAEVPVKPAAVAGGRKSAVKPSKQELPDENVEMEVPLKGGDSDEDEEEERSVDDFALDKSVVYRPGSTKSKKPKRSVFVVPLSVRLLTFSSRPA